MIGSMRNLDEMISVWGPRLEERLVASVKGLGLLSDMAEYHLTSGGKRLRGLIPLWIMGNIGRDPNDAMPLALCLELMHNGTLVFQYCRYFCCVRGGSRAGYGEVFAVAIGVLALSG